MARSHRLNLRAADPPWREIAMPGANYGIQLVRLASDGDDFTILGRFPRGFERSVPGGYAVTEEFLILDGELELEGTEVGRGDLCVVPAGAIRAPMRSPQGCTVLAWFAGPAIFQGAEDLRASDAGRVADCDGSASDAGGPAQGFRAVQVLAASAGPPVLCTAEATWQICSSTADLAASDGMEVIDTALTTWLRWADGSAGPLPSGPWLVRRSADPVVGHL